MADSHSAFFTDLWRLFSFIVVALGYVRFEHALSSRFLVEGAKLGDVDEGREE